MYLLTSMMKEKIGGGFKRFEEQKTKKEEIKNPEWKKEDIGFARTLGNHFVIENSKWRDKAIDAVEKSFDNGRGITEIWGVEGELLRKPRQQYSVEIDPPEVSRPMEVQSLSSLKKYKLIDENKMKEDVKENGICFSQPYEFEYYLTGENNKTNYDRIVWRDNIPTIIWKGISGSEYYQGPKDESLTSLDRLEDITLIARKYRQEKEERINGLKEKMEQLKEKLIILENDLRRQDVGIEMLEEELDKLKKYRESAQQQRIKKFFDDK